MQLDLADSNLSHLTDKISSLQLNQTKCCKKYNKLQSFIKKVQSFEKEQDLLLESQLKQMSSENESIQKDLKEIKDKIPLLELKKNDIVNVIQDQVSSKDLTAVFSDIEDQNKITDILQEMLHNVAKLLDNKILFFSDVINKLSSERDQNLINVVDQFERIEKRFANDEDQTNECFKTLNDFRQMLAEVKQMSSEADAQEEVKLFQ